MGGLRRGCSYWHTLTRTVPPCPRVMLSLPSLRVTLSKNITSFRRRSPNFPVTRIAFLSISIKMYSHRSVTVKISPEMPMTVGPVTVQIGSKTQLAQAGGDGESNKCQDGSLKGEPRPQELQGGRAWLCSGVLIGHFKFFFTISICTFQPSSWLYNLLLTVFSSFYVTTN